MTPAQIQQKGHANVALFVPHGGCTHQCSFCNQKEITGFDAPPSYADVFRLCKETEETLKARGGTAQFAFFGGSFTALNRDYMRSLLEAVQPFLKSGCFSGIRISTRPDCVDQPVLELLARYGVSAIELGAQSMDDSVLAKNQRGHTAGDVKTAASLIRRGGFELGLQMMTGLYGSGEDADKQTAVALAALKPDTVRVYPTLVLEGTPLAALYRKGFYQPASLAAAVALCAWLLDFFERQDIRVIRMGLHAQDSLEKTLLAGPYHPAFRELCQGDLLRRRVLSALEELPKGTYRLKMSLAGRSKIAGHQARPVAYFHEFGYDIKIETDPLLSGMDFLLIPGK